ncbi:MAG: SpoIIE family protein phosphatase [Candidatus Hydrogenedentes bacterium]|nr:SpoIIE family protein phosphatase [Candidatus Hydrogenedentota bacterium]
MSDTESNLKSPQNAIKEEAVPVRSRPDLFMQLSYARDILDSLGDGLLVVDRNQRALLCNHTTRQLLGQDLPSITADGWSTRYQYLLSDTAVPARIEDVPLIQAVRGAALTRQETHISRPGIRNVWLSVTSRPVHDGSGALEWTYIIIRDINLRVWAEEHMRLRDRAMASASEGIVIIDARHVKKPIIFASEGFERLTGYTQEETVGRECGVLFGAPLESVDLAAAQADLKDERPIAVELQNNRKDGTPFWYRLSVTPVRDSGGALTHYIAIISDITKLVESDQKIRESAEQLQEANAKITWANERMKNSLEAAARVQQALLPSSLPEIAGANFAWAFEPDEELSGDILNVIQLDDDHVGVYILDVTGHGVASAMLSVTVSRLLSPVRSATALVYERVPDSTQYTVATPGKVATRLAMRFEWEPQAGLMFTIVYGVLNCRTREFSYACAGHPPPVYVTKDDIRILEQTNGLPIGIGSGDYDEKTVTIEPDSRLYFYSDGISESMDTNENLFGQDGIIASLRELRAVSLEESVAELMDRAKRWRDGGPIKDDMSLLALEVTALDAG